MLLPEKNQKVISEVMEMLINLIVVIISQYICVTNLTVYSLNLYNVICQLYLNKAGKNKCIED